MTYRIPPLIDALKKYTGWFPFGYGLESAYAPAGLSGGSAAPAGTLLGFSRFASPRPLDLFLFCLFVLTAISYASSPKRKLPPHPRRTPIIGNLSQMTDKKWLFSRECKEQFGEVMCLDVFGRPTIVFNSLKSAFDVLERRARNSSGRPRFIVASKILNQGLGLALTDHGDFWRRMRRASHDALTKSVVQRYHPIQTKEANILVTSLLNNPKDIKHHFMRAGASTIMAILYDYPSLRSEHDNSIEQIERSIRWSTQAAGLGSSLVEVLPWMLYIPQRFAKWKRKAWEQSAMRSEMYLRLFNRVKVDLVRSGVSFSASLIELRDQYRLSEKEMAYLSGNMYGAGSETTSTTLMWWTLAMVTFPQVQRRAQAELDAVVGRTRLPTFADAPHLPYVRAIIKEVLRWRPPVPLGVPHKATEDDWYEGMFIPKGATCVANIWQCNHDRAIFGDDADKFRPERHLDDKGELGSGPIETNQEGHASFGFGRRICVGKHLANDSLFIHTARILWTANLECVKDENGRDVLPDMNGFTDTGLIIHPPPHDCRITPRFPEIETILAAEGESFEC